MADIVLHGAQGAVIGWWIAWVIYVWNSWVKWTFTIVLGIVGALPDLIGAYGNLILHDNWALYGLAHHGWLADWLSVLPPYWLHLRLDFFFHQMPGGHWWPALAWLDILLWLITLGAGFLLWKAERKWL